MKKFNVYFWNGIKSNIPLCCIFFFMTDTIHKINETWYEFGDGYIRCPDCIIEDMNWRKWESWRK